MKALKILLWGQGVYYLMSGLWPLADIESFMDVTGPKTDIWLVKTVGILLLPVSASLLSYIYDGQKARFPAFVLGAGSAAAFACVDFYYSGRGIISDVYAADGLVQIVFLLLWAIIALKLLRRRPPQVKPRNSRWYRPFHSHPHDGGEAPWGSVH